MMRLSSAYRGTQNILNLFKDKKLRSKKLNNLISNFFRRKGSINVLLLYFHRYLRLTPLLILTVLFSISLLKFFGNGPNWTQRMNIALNNCELYWWSTLLYVQNYVNPGAMVSETTFQNE